MVWHPGEKEIAAVQKLSPENRYRYLIKSAADHELIWSLWSDGWALLGDDTGREIVPIWPHATYALAFAKGEWLHYEPKQINLDAWTDRWLPGIKRNGRLVAVFPSPHDKGAVVEADQLASDLKDELAKY